MPKVVDHEARRREISAIAARLIARGGLQRATIRDISAASGYSKGVVEHYFDSKDELISGALDWANRSYEARSQRATCGMEGLAALRERIVTTLPLHTTGREEWKVRIVFWSLAAINETLRRQQAARFDRTIDFFAQDIRKAIECGELDAAVDAGEAARHLVNYLSGVCVAALHNRRLYTPAALQREAEFLLRQLHIDAVGSGPGMRA